MANETPGTGAAPSRQARLQRWAAGLRSDVLAIRLAACDRRVPWPAKLVAALVAAYALSPIDLIPDFIPVIGWLDDLILVPLGLMLAVRMIPPDVLADLRLAARAQDAPRSRTAAVVIVALWLAGTAATLHYAVSWFAR